MKEFITGLLIGALTLHALLSFVPIQKKYNKVYNKVITKSIKTSYVCNKGFKLICSK